MKRTDQQDISEQEGKGTMLGERRKRQRGRKNLHSANSLKQLQRQIHSRERKSLYIRIRQGGKKPRDAALAVTHDTTDAEDKI